MDEMRRADLPESHHGEVTEEPAMESAGSTGASDDIILEAVTMRTSRALTVVPEERPASMLSTLAHAGAVAWRQPAVRAAVRTGASAVALSLAVRLAGRMVANRGARQIAAKSALPTLSSLLGASEQLPALPTTRRGRGVEVSETFIYVRRVMRR